MKQQGQPRIERVSLVNPNWTFEGSTYWACVETHLPLELLYSEALLSRAGFACQVVDAHLENMTLDEVAARVDSFGPDMVVLTTAPSYLFWRCCQAELTVPAALCEELRRIAPVIAIGPHGSATPGYVFREMACAGLVRGEPEEELVRLAQGSPGDSVVWRGAANVARSSISVVDVKSLPPLSYRNYPMDRRTHRHHVFWGEGRGAEVEFSRGCPYGCSFCNRKFFRGRYRERPVDTVLKELRALRALGIDYVYFIDELFGLGRCSELLEALRLEPIVQFGCETRIDLWNEDRLDSLAAAGCISVEFGLESPFPEIQTSLNKGYRIAGDRILELMVHAKSKIPWVQGDMMEVPEADEDLRRRTEEWRREAIGRGVWVSEPIKTFLYPGCDLHEQIIGPLDDGSWKRARDASSSAKDPDIG